MPKGTGKLLKEREIGEFHVFEKRWPPWIPKIERSSAILAQVLSLSNLQSFSWEAPSRGIRTSRDRERLFATRSRCTLRSAISGVERVVEFDRRITGRKLYTLARIALGLKSHADSTSILLTLGGSEVRPHDFACWQLFQDAHIEYVLHK